ncbi:hypothetical protein J5N97_008361 [Dioscorea zingiberensis]|uniref:Uncharacterized protein n=1 Tax=Dioscorea zingiberensis TaxID=325984 RepID=A0A9D5CUL8_9LILI|nr:hypothetical protein J5N97_008361 [Dioscorea zingiberensis]
MTASKPTGSLFPCCRRNPPPFAAIFRYLQFLSNTHQQHVAQYQSFLYQNRSRQQHNGSFPIGIHGTEQLGNGSDSIGGNRIAAAVLVGLVLEDLHGLLQGVLPFPSFLYFFSS